MAQRTDRRSAPKSGPSPQTPSAKAVKERLAADRKAALRLTPVSRETEARLAQFVDLLLVWQTKLNLVSSTTLGQLWTRHVADSLQLLDLAPEAQRWVDLGSGAGFPGLVLACALADQPGTEVHLVESNAKKAALLREAARHIGAPAIVHAVRIEDFVKNFNAPADVVTARALAPLDQLLALAEPILNSGAKGLFPKGQDVEVELTNAAKCWSMDMKLVASKTQPQSRIVVVNGLRRRTRES